MRYQVGKTAVGGADDFGRSADPGGAKGAEQEASKAWENLRLLLPPAGHEVTNYHDWKQVTRLQAGDPLPLLMPSFSMSS